MIRHGKPRKDHRTRKKGPKSQQEAQNMNRPPTWQTRMCCSQCHSRIPQSHMSVTCHSHMPHSHVIATCHSYMPWSHAIVMCRSCTGQSHAIVTCHSHMPQSHAAVTGHSHLQQSCRHLCCAVHAAKASLPPQHCSLGPCCPHCSYCCCCCYCSGVCCPGAYCQGT